MRATSNILNQIRDKFPWKYVLFVKYNSYITEDYYFFDLSVLNDFIKDIDDNCEYVAYSLEPKYYELKKDKEM